MTLAELSIKRPVLATVFAIIITLFGVVGFLSLGVREYPSVDPAVVTVRTDYTGANADIIESQITEPLEEAINSVEGVKTLSSISTDGRSTITVEFSPEIDLNNAANDVRDKVSQAIRNLPPDADPPVVQKADADAQFILSITVQSNERSMLELSEIGTNVFKERIQTVPGVSQVRIWGDKKYAMRLKLDQAKMQAYNITAMDVRNAVNTQNVELPSGRIEGDQTELTVRTLGRVNTPEEFDNLVIASRSGNLIRLRDIGQAEIGAENERSLLRGNGVIPMIGVAVQPQPGANYIEIVDETFKRVEQIKKELPDDIYLNVALDTTVSIRKAIEEVQETIFIAFILVLLIIFFFLRSWKSTLIPVVVIPIALIGSFAILYLAGFSINVLTLLGLVLATGLVVDDSIVVMENIYAKIEAGMPPMQAAFKGANEVFFAVIATSIALVCVFLPIFFIEGLTGRLFREFAMVVTSAIVLSTFISLSLTPMMSSRILRKSKRNGKTMQVFKLIVDRSREAYERTLVSFMQKRWLVWPIIAVIGFMIWLIGAQIPSELAPMEDKSRLRITANAPEGTSYAAMDEYQKKIMELLDTLPEKQFLLGVTAPSFGSSNSVNSSFVRITLKQPGERERSQMEIAREVSRKLKQFPFAETFVIQEPTISASRGGRNSLPVQMVLQAPDLKRL
ncbi:MAG: efflux RND transporter permease subunit, partial [Salibacteraceae bacterium]